MKTISIIKNKGGVGKTTTTHNLGVALARKGLSVALIDFDPQANLSFLLDHSDKLDLRTALLEMKALDKDDFSTTSIENLYLLLNNSDVDSELFDSINAMQRLNLLKKILSNSPFDFVLIDTPPTLDHQIFNCFVASDYVLIPVEYEILSAMGLQKLMENFETAKEESNPQLDLLGILVTKLDQRFSMNEAMASELKKAYQEKVFDTAIRTNTKYKQGQALQQDIYSMQDRKGMEDFDGLANEILQRVKK
jgi:chromosome partitioning protein